MITVYIAPGIGTGNGTGPGDAQAARDFSRVNWQPGITVLIRRGTSLYLPPIANRAGLFIRKFDGITIGAYGDAEQPPVLHSAMPIVSGWSHTGNGIYSVRAPATAGVVLYEDNPLPFFDDTVPNVRNLMVASDAGGYMINSGGDNPVVFVRLPGGANPNKGGVSVSVSPIGIECTHDTPVSDLTIEDLELRGFSRQGINLRNVRNSIVRRNIIHSTGGDRSPSWYVGGCVQCVDGCDGIEITQNHVYDCFDSPFSPQIPAGYNGGLIQNITYSDNLIDGGWALGGVEIANWASGGTIRNIRIEGNRISGGGTGFSGMGDGPRGPVGVIVNANYGAGVSNRFENISIRHNLIEKCPSGGIFVEHANAKNLLIDGNTIRECGVGGSRGRAGNGQVQLRGGISIATGLTIDQDVRIIANEIAECGNFGISFDSKNAVSAGRIVNNTLVRNGDFNISVRGDSALPELRNNICHWAGIRKRGAGSIVENYNNVYLGDPDYDGL